MDEIAIYDLDKTITKRPTYGSFLRYAAWHHEKWRLLALPIVLGTLVGYVFGLINRARLKEINQELLLGPMIDAQKLAAIAGGFAERTIGENVHPQALAQIAADRAAGRKLVIASASYAFYVVPIGRLLGFETVIATGSKRTDDGAILPKIDGENCYGEAKLRMVSDWLDAASISPEEASIRFYSDSSSDLPVFELSKVPIATNPSAKLRRIAEKRHWRIIAWA